MKPVDNCNCRLIVAGSRGYTDREKICTALFFRVDDDTAIITGGCPNSPDGVAAEFAQQDNVPLEICKADWDRYGKAAGPHRNRHMAQRGTHLLAFWDGKSRGTANMILEAHRCGLNVEVELI